MYSLMLGIHALWGVYFHMKRCTVYPENEKYLEQGELCAVPLIAFDGTIQGPPVPNLRVSG